MTKFDTDQLTQKIEQVVLEHLAAIERAATEAIARADPAALKLIHLGGVKLIHPKLNNQTTAS